MEALKSYITEIFRYLGVLEQKRGKLLFLGLDNAGKTSLLGMLTTGKMVAAKPTGHPTNEQFRVGGVNLNAYDLGGHDNGRLLWSSYFTKVDGVVFMVDSSDYQRLDLVKNEIDKLLLDPDLARAPICIIGNKIDLPNSLGKTQLVSVLGLDGLCTGVLPKQTPKGTRPLEVFMASVIRGIGYGEAINWISSYLADV